MNAYILGPKTIQRSESSDPSRGILTFTEHRTGDTIDIYFYLEDLAILQQCLETPGTYNLTPFSTSKTIPLLEGEQK